MIELNGFDKESKKKYPNKFIASICHISKGMNKIVFVKFFRHVDFESDECFSIMAKNVVFQLRQNIFV